MHINPTIFREYDIRGIAGREFSPQAVAEYEKWYGRFPGITITLEGAEAIGAAYGTMIRRAGGRRVVVGHEVRPFAEELKAAFARGIRVSGCDVTDLGVSLTPIVYFTVAAVGYDGGANVTGSHNVYFFNGFKLTASAARPIAGQALQELRGLIEREEFVRDAEGEYVKKDGYGAYKEYVLNHTKLARPFRVVIDCGNGSAGVFAPDLFRSLGCEVIELFCEPDATFPHHMPDPQYVQYMQDLTAAVKAAKADLGIGFDADADRVGFVTETGAFVEADLTHLVFTREVLSRHPGKKVIWTVKTSKLLEEFIPRYGGLPVLHRQGHAPIKETLHQDHDIIFAAEDTGHFYFVEDYFRIDDGPWAAAKMLEILSRRGVALSALLEGIPPRVRTPEIKLPCADEEKFSVVERIKEALSRRFPAVTIDGVRIQVSPTGWGLIRPSNTTPYLSVRVEGASPQEVITIKNILADELEKFPEIADGLNRNAVATLTGKLGWV